MISWTKRFPSTCKTSLGILLDFWFFMRTLICTRKVEKQKNVVSGWLDLLCEPNLWRSCTSSMSVPMQGQDSVKLMTTPLSAHADYALRHSPGMHAYQNVRQGVACCYGVRLEPTPSWERESWTAPNSQQRELDFCVRYAPTAGVIQDTLLLVSNSHLCWGRKISHENKRGGRRSIFNYKVTVYERHS